MLFVSLLVTTHSFNCTSKNLALNGDRDCDNSDQSQLKTR